MDSSSSAVAPPYLVADLARHHAVVTGANSGIGLQVTRNLMAMGAHVTMICRNAARGTTAKKALDAERWAGSCSVILADLSDPASIHRCGAAIERNHERVDLLVNNGAVYLPACVRTPIEGIEQTWATNVLGYHRMLRALEPLLMSAPTARVVHVSSAMASEVRFDDPYFVRRRYSGAAAYRQSKAANRMLAWAWSRRLNPNSIGIHAVDPGQVSTALGRHQTGAWGALVRAGFRWVHRDVALGSQLTTFVAASPGLPNTSPLYFSRGRARRCRFDDRQRQDTLFALCEKPALGARAISGAAARSKGDATSDSASRPGRQGAPA